MPKWLLREHISTIYTLYTCVTIAPEVIAIHWLIPRTDNRSNMTGVGLSMRSPELYWDVERPSHRYILSLASQYIYYCVKVRYTMQWLIARWKLFLGRILDGKLLKYLWLYNVYYTCKFYPNYINLKMKAMSNHKNHSYSKSFTKAKLAFSSLDRLCMVPYVMTLYNYQLWTTSQQHA